jgi:hypothetical protein
LAAKPSGLSLAGFSAVEVPFKLLNGLPAWVSGFGAKTLVAEPPKRFWLWKDGVVVEVFGLASGDICIESAGVEEEFMALD